MRTQTRSPTPSASRSRDCANGSASPGSSPPCPASATASIREETVDRPPGLSVRLKLTLSYAGFLMLAGALLLAAGLVFLLRYVPDAEIFNASGLAPDRLIIRGDALTALRLLWGVLRPAVASALAFLLVFGLLGGWLLAGRMLAPLARITHATRLAANGSLSHRIRLP